MEGGLPESKDLADGVWDLAYLKWEILSKILISSLYPIIVANHAYFWNISLGVIMPPK